jgi:hypothetical protein
MPQRQRIGSWQHRPAARASHCKSARLTPQHRPAAIIARENLRATIRCKRVFY